jgi:type II secretory pathway pseudopilin PulG
VTDEMRRSQGASGFSSIELLFAAGLVATLSGVAVPSLLRTLDDHRAASAARYIASRLQRARMEAVLRSVNVAVYFSTSGEFATYVDGNGNGVLSADIRDGADPRLGAPERVSTSFGGVVFGVLAGLPPIEAGAAAPGSDPIHLGSSDSASFTPLGTSSSGSVYIRSRLRQVVVRIYGDTGKVRVLRFDEGTRQWSEM